MLRIIIFSFAIVVLAGCGKKENTGTTKPGTTNLATNPDYIKGLGLVTKNDCLTCHKVDEKLVGPAYRDVAAKYAGQPGVIDSLAAKVMKGGSGVWGDVPMAAHPNLSKDDAVAMVKYIMLLKK